MTTNQHEHLDDDAKTLAEMGYAQELRRGMSAFSNFAISFSIISILAGCITSYKIALISGGPSALTLGWLIVGLMVLAVSLAMAEVCSRYPTAGGLYFWAGRLAKTNKRQWAWFVGWFNFMGEVAVTAAIDFGCATTWMAFASLMGWVDEVTPVKLFATFVVIIVAHALLNTFGVKLVALLSNISAWWHVAGVLIIVAVLWILPEKHQSVSWTLTGFHNETGWTFLPYVFLMGLLMAQYTFTGYDASAHVSEETKNASRAAPRGIVMSVLVSLIAGFILLFSITAAVPDRSEEGLTALAGSETGLPPAQIFLDSLGPDVAKFLLFIVCVAQFLCGMASVTANSRMTYAFSRDNALPGSRIWAKVNPKTGTPTNSIWLCVVLSIILASPALVSGVAYLAVTSIAVIGLYIAYVTPVFLRRIRPDFQPGPWNLGRYSAPIGWIAVIWVAFICILFVLPPASPVTLQTFNYAPVAVIAVVIIALVTWQAWGKNTFMRGAQDEHMTKARDQVLNER
jgi:amino acid permease (GABA permease)